ncbi:MAG: hypothetical protein HGA20_15035 [Geobacteraceae bacterium]|nr:hypothetical protein [Geobacteraceae bacterium]
MKFSPYDIADILITTGEAISIGLDETFGKFKLAGKLVQLYDGSVSTSGPTLIISETDAELVTENETIITVRDVDYQATQKIDTDTGFIELELTKDFA